MEDGSTRTSLEVKGVLRVEATLLEMPIALSRLDDSISTATVAN